MSTTEVNTYSAAVDAVINRSGRPDRKSDIIAYTRQTARECRVLRYFDRDFVEDQLTTDAEPYIWTYPQEFRAIYAVRYPSVQDGQGNYIHPKLMRPGRGQEALTYFYYPAADYFVFAGQGVGSLIDIGYYQYPKKLPYYDGTNDARPAKFILETDAWVYDAAYDIDDASRQTARNLVSDWLYFHWYDLVVEGALAKIFKTVGDQRAPQTFALYKSFQKDLLEGERHKSLDY